MLTFGKSLFQESCFFCWFTVKSNSFSTVIFLLAPYIRCFFIPPKSETLTFWRLGLHFSLWSCYSSQWQRGSGHCVHLFPNTVDQFRFTLFFRYVRMLNSLSFQVIFFVENSNYHCYRISCMWNQGLLFFILFSLSLHLNCLFCQGQWCSVLY